MKSTLAHYSGLEAEGRVADFYQRSGRAVAARRWRGSAGEIDIVARDGDRVIFIEVKKANSHAEAAERLSARQIARICGTACEFIGGEPQGQNTEIRFDVALVDHAGRIDILENAFATL